jgi:hypothetical protein
MYPQVPFDEAYFKTFDLERVCIDRVVLHIYDGRYSTEEHSFDEELATRHFQAMKRSRVKNGRYEDVLHYQPKPYTFFELRLKGARSMYVYVNIIEYVQDMKGIKPDSSLVIHESNFMPLDCTLTAADYIKALYEVVEHYKNEYKRLVKEFWGEDLEDIKASVSVMEIPFEVSPCSVDEIASRLDNDGIAFKKYNTQSATLYLTENKSKTEIELPNGLDLHIPEDFDSIYLNGINGGYKENKIQLKFYQKTFGMVRIEFTIYKEEVKAIFSFHNPEIHEDAERLVRWIHKQLRDRDKVAACVKRYDVSLENIVKIVASMTGLSEDLIYRLKDVEVFESSRKTHNLRRKLMKKHLLEPITDDLGRSKRKIYRVTSQFKAMLNSFKPKGHESFLPGYVNRKGLL